MPRLRDDITLDYDNPLLEPERRVRVRRNLTPWEDQANKWSSPKREFKCCGTVFKAVTLNQILALREAHSKTHH